METLESRQLLAADVLINEIHYDPDVRTERVEFVELYNAGDEVADLSGWNLSNAISYTFPSGTTLAPDGYLVVAELPDAVLERFGVASLGPYEGGLRANGETIELLDAAQQLIDHVDYQLGFPWPTVGDAPGYSVELIHPSLDNQLGGSWRASVGTQTVFDEGEVWSYFKGLSEPSEDTSWRQKSFDDSGWEQGASPIGFGSRVPFGTELTDMRQTRSNPTGYTSVYFRKTFQVDDPSAVGGLTLQAFYDDGINVWINGTHVAGENVFEENLPFNFVANTSRSDRDFADVVLPDPSTYLVEGENVIAVQLLNQSITNSDAFFDARLLNTSNRPPGPSPGMINSVYSTDAAPQMRQVDHSPNQPKSGEDVTITVKVTDPDGVQSVTLDYQTVDPGDYIELTDARYATQWTTLPMRDDGMAGDAVAGDDYYTVVLPGELQTHRRLIRYRITSTDNTGRSITGPYEDDPQPNFAYFVYDGIPDWTASWRPGVEPEVTYSSDVLESLPVYQLITTRQSHEDAMFIPDSELRSGDTSAEYRWMGTLVYDGDVYDHIRYRARGGVWRYAMGKNMWKFDFNRGHSFQARDDYGNSYETKWDKMNFSALIQQGNYEHRGEQGLFESVGFKLFNLAGTESPNTNFLQFRIIEGADEQGADQYSGDFQGMYMTIEQPDGRFLDEHGLPDGNLYKIEGNRAESTSNQSRTQVDDASDVTAFIRAFTGNNRPDEQWWRDQVDLEKYYGYQAIDQGIHHYDVAFGKNFYYFSNPETGLWEIHPWDLDLTWADNMYGNENHEFNMYIAKNPDFNHYENPQNQAANNRLNKEYQNRTREILDLLYNQEQTGMLIDEYASFIYQPGEVSFVDADRAMWDYNPILTSSYTNPSKNGQSYHYYDRARTKDFPGMIQILKDYVDRRTDWINGRILTNEDLIPHTPTLTYLGDDRFPVNGLTFQSSAFSSPVGTTFAAMEWRLAEVTDPADPSFDPYDRDTPRKYEIQSDWESGELTTFNDTIAIPGQNLEVGRTYRARVRMLDSDGHWSHWSDAVQFVTAPAAGIELEDLRITEINYHPYPTPDDATNENEFEFIELANVGDSTLDLNGVRFTDGIQFEFSGSSVTALDPGARTVVVRNQEAFASRYGTDIAVAGQFASGGLSNGGEELKLVDGSGNTILQFIYGDGDPWPNRADGGGSSLEVIDTAGSYSSPDNWRSSADYGGSPGRAGTAPIRDVVINELLTNTDPPQTDAIELHNTTNSPVDISGWFLSDDGDSLQKFAIPAGTEIPAGGYVVFDESHFNPSGDNANDFALNGSRGEEVWLVAADDQGNLTRFVDHVQFGTTATGVSLGRWPDGTGELRPMDHLTLGGPNSRPRAGEVIISELHYNPPDLDGNGRQEADDFEFIELYNRTEQPIDVGGWSISGIDYTFAPGTTIESGQTTLLVRFDPSDDAATQIFQFLTGISTSVPLIGPFGDPLSNEGGTLRLERPDTPPPDDPDFTPILLVDEVVYANTAPWPTEADGGGKSLTRVSSIVVGDIASSWTAEEPSPGTFDFFVRQAGDANEDGVFDQSDIVLTLQGGKYLTGTAATWSEGDWNEDGLFDGKDIVAALQTGNYGQGPYAAEAPADASSLRITEINYNPHEPMLPFGERETDSDDFEFIELANVGLEPINLEGVRFTRVTVDADYEGVDFVFAAQTLNPGDHVVVVKDREAFQSRYGNAVRIALGNDGQGGAQGEYGGGLSNNKEQLTLMDRGGAIIQQFSYNDSGGWPGRADGNGSSLEVVDTNGDYSDSDNWRSSSEFGGSPSRPGLGPDNRIVFNEILAHTDPPDVDMIELMNTTDTPINISNWYLTDTNTNYLKFRIAADSLVLAGGYHVLTETQFADTLGALSSYQGEDLWLIEPDANGKPARFVDTVSFEATENGVSVGRWLNGEGRLFPMAQLTLGGENTGPKVPDVMISEVHYNPVDPDGDGPLREDDFEYVELHNRSVSAVDLSGWRLDGGIELAFAKGTLIAPGETIVAVPFLPENADQAALFRSAYGVDSPIRLVGPYNGRLDNGGETLRLEWADEPPSVQPDFIPWILEDRVDYDDKAPWPTSPDGRGDALARASLTSFGGFPEGWTARGPNPGTADLFVRQAGDANEDRSFDQLDLVQVLAAQRFGTNLAATWQQGDWNDDGLFDRFDIVAALTAGNYLKGPQPASSPVDAVLADWDPAGS